MKCLAVVELRRSQQFLVKLGGRCDLRVGDVRDGPGESGLFENSANEVDLLEFGKGQLADVVSRIALVIDKALADKGFQCFTDGDRADSERVGDVGGHDLSAGRRAAGKNESTHLLEYVRAVVARPGLSKLDE
ncbi:Uncharacterised protein [Mycobacteroides abscessus subsp. abscessus]|nr:Uncharacterised protein [Mycobacteroides abscessus subsp. abscessus]